MSFYPSFDNDRKLKSHKKIKQMEELFEKANSLEEKRLIVDQLNNLNVKLAQEYLIEPTNLNEQFKKSAKEDKKSGSKRNTTPLHKNLGSKTENTKAIEIFRKKKDK